MHFSELSLRSPFTFLAFASICLMAVLLTTVVRAAFPNWHSPSTGLFVVNERRWYASATELLSWDIRRAERVYAQSLRLESTSSEVRLVGSLGMNGYLTDLQTTVLDRYTLTDPLRSRLPFDRSIDRMIGHKRVRPGHLSRAYPPDYIQSIETGENRIGDPEIARLYEGIVLMTRAPLVSLERWRAILRLGLP